jgi:uncharacterized membrane protein SirB2
MRRNRQLFVIGYLILILGAVFFLFLYDTTNYSFYAHLSAVFIEISLSIVIIEFFLEYTRKQETFRIYSLARNYIFETVFSSFNHVVFANSNNLDVVDQLGYRPSFAPYMKKNKVLGGLAKDILENMSREEMISLAEIVQKDFPNFERFANTQLTFQNKDLFNSLIRFLDFSHRISVVELNDNNLEDILYSVENDSKIPGYDLSWKDVYYKLIYYWLYIINNFIYFSDKDSRLLRKQLKSNLNFINFNL